jgi:hypothetical protein
LASAHCPPLAGALAAGFAKDLWTWPWVGELIKRRFIRSYGESQVWRILVALGFSCQPHSSLGNLTPSEFTLKSQNNEGTGAMRV